MGAAMSEILTAEEMEVIHQARLTVETGISDNLANEDYLAGLLAIIDRLTADENSPEEDAALDAGLHALSEEVNERLAQRIVDALGLWRTPLARHAALTIVREQIATWWEPIPAAEAPAEVRSLSGNIQDLRPGMTAYQLKRARLPFEALAAEAAAERKRCAEEVRAAGCICEGLADDGFGQYFWQFGVRHDHRCPIAIADRPEATP
jgi:hypothetical protein